MKKNKNKSNLDFRVMSFFFKIRDKFHAPIEKIRNAHIKTEDIVLDYGCGSGSFTIVGAEEIGSKGKIFAADIHPLALIKVRKRGVKKGFTNIETIQTEGATGLNDESIDVVICFDVIHDIPNKKALILDF